MRVRIPIIASDAAPAAAPRDDPPKVRFARDSPLEGAGFELSVPRRDAELVGHITDMATEPGKERLTHLL